MKTFKTVLQILVLVFLIAVFFITNQLNENPTDGFQLIGNIGVYNFLSGLCLVLFVVSIILEGIELRRLKVSRLRLEQEVMQLKAKLYDKQEDASKKVPPAPDKPALEDKKEEDKDTNN